MYSDEQCCDQSHQVASAYENCTPLIPLDSCGPPCAPEMGRRVYAWSLSRMPEGCDARPDDFSYGSATRS